MITEEKVEDFIKKNFEPVDDKPGYVWYSKRNFQIISIETLKKRLCKVLKGEEKMKKCDFCDLGRALVNGKTNDYGISINYLSHIGYHLVAYGYDVHGADSNGLAVKINYCPICGRKLGDE